MVGMRLGLDGGSWGHFTNEEKHGTTSDEDSSNSRSRNLRRRSKESDTDNNDTADRPCRLRTRSVNAAFDAQHQASVSDFLIYQRQKQDISVDDMTDAEIKQKILDLENEVLAYKSALAKRHEADSMFTSFYY